MNKLFVTLGESGYAWEEIGHKLLGEDFCHSCAQYYAWEFVEGIQENFNGSPSMPICEPRRRLHE